MRYEDLRFGTDNVEKGRYTVTIHVSGDGCEYAVNPFFLSTYSREEADEVAQLVWDNSDRVVEECTRLLGVPEEEMEYTQFELRETDESAASRRYDDVMSGFSDYEIRFDVL